MGPRGSADPTHEGRDGLPPVRDFSPRRRQRPAGPMGSRGSADPTHEGRDGLPPVRDFSPVAGSDPQDRWGRAAARTLPTRVGTGCRPSVTSPRVDGIGSTPKRAAVTGASRPRPVGSSAFRRLDRTPCRAAWTRDPGHDMLRLRARCAMPPTPSTTRPQRSQFRATSADGSATSDHTPHDRPLPTNMRRQCLNILSARAVVQRIPWWPA